MMNTENLFGTADIRGLRVAHLRAMLEHHGYAIRLSLGDWGQRVWVEGPGLPYLFNGFADECADYTAASVVARKMVALGLLDPSVVIRTVHQEN